eukprot:superscaffoldBa00002896_g15592
MGCGVTKSNQFHKHSKKGDLHGQLEDLLLIFYKNGMPSMEKPYVFNGDFVDRGRDSIEILLILFAFLLVYPTEVHLNRGNHEDHIINLRYGFTKEVLSKYKMHGKRILKLLQKIFSWLPLATVIDQKVLVLHGGISNTTDLSILARVDRHNILDLLWSDPMSQDGCIPNELRGGGCYWGPDVTEDFLNRHNLQLIIRSHECKQDGYEFCHNRKILTLFSASNYYDVGSNRGAYVKLGPDLVPYLVQYQASSMIRELTVRQSVGRTERSALKVLREQLFSHKSDLICAFKKFDGENTGVCSHIDQSLIETLYRHRSTLETIFRIVDTDNSGFITMEDFRQTWKLLSVYLKMEITDEAISDLAVTIDSNQDGSIDIEEFMEAFRLTDKKSRLERGRSMFMGTAPDLTKLEGDPNI